VDIQYLCIAFLLFALVFAMGVRASRLGYNLPETKVAEAPRSGKLKIKSMAKKKLRTKLTRVERAVKNLAKAKANLKLARLIEKAINEAKNSQG